ncbi:glycoprotease family-domain-containing protein [Aspergillus unguis]
MLLLRHSLAAGRPTLYHARPNIIPRRGILTLAIETSCDDTSVAIIQRRGNSATKWFNEKITADLTAYQGIHPLAALESHQENLATLVKKALRALPRASDDLIKGELERLDPRLGRDSLYGKSPILPLSGSVHDKPDVICVTRGPGMRANLNVGLDFAKGLAVAWQVPLIGVNHMQAHLLTPRLVSALQTSYVKGEEPPPLKPEFPFVSILASGGHTLLVNSTSIVDHTVLATSPDIAVGEALDKAAREILPTSILANAETTMYAKLLYEFAFPNGRDDYADYRAPMTRAEEIARSKVQTPYGLSFTTPFANTRTMAFSFAHLSTVVGQLTRIKQQAEPGNPIMTHDDRVFLAREVLRTSFEHIASRTIIGLEQMCEQTKGSDPKPIPETLPIKTLVVSGGVAANSFLRRILRSFLDARGFNKVQIDAPPAWLCTDNAAMVGWAGMEMFREGWRSQYNIRSLRKWSLDKRLRAASGPGGGPKGILGASGWTRLPSDRERE